MAADDPLDLLLPRPQRVARAPGTCALRAALRVRAGAEAAADLARAPAAAAHARLEGAIAERALARGSDAARATELRVAREPGRAGGYRLRVGPGGLDLTACDAAGLAHGLTTLAQLVRAAPSTGGALALPSAELDDWPDFRSRGVSWDVSRSRVPTLPSLLDLAGELAALKADHLQLYTEHAFAYARHERVWRGASPLEPADVRALDERCRELGIDLAANQQSFGHLHRWLVHDPYRALAEVPEGIEHAWSRGREPFGLCATDPASVAFLEGLYDELLPCFTSRWLHVGFDEAIDLGLGRSRARCEALGKERVWLEFLTAVEGRVRARGRRAMYWADALEGHPELAPSLPREALACVWGYEAAFPFEQRVAPLAAAGIPFAVAPGTQAWQSVAGRLDEALGNQEAAARAGLEHGAELYLVTEWGDRGHLQPLACALPGLAAGVARAWNARAPLDARSLAAALDAHVYREPGSGLGEAACALARAYLATGCASTNGSALFFLVAFADAPLPHARMPGLGPEGLERALGEVEAARARIAAARTATEQGARFTRELAWAADLLAFAARLGLARLARPPGEPLPAMAAAERSRLATELAGLVTRHRLGWFERDRPGGLEESAAWLERPLALLGG